MLIRKVKKEDYETIYKLIKTAFETAKVKDGNEQDLVEMLRKTSAYIDELDLVCVKDNKIIAHIMFTKQILKTEDKTITALILAPVCVEINSRNKGIGETLIRKGLEIAKDLGYTYVFVVGDPSYYNRFGFSKTTNFNITNTNSIPEQFVMCCELEKGPLANIKGNVDVSLQNLS